MEAMVTMVIRQSGRSIQPTGQELLLRPRRILIDCSGMAEDFSLHLGALVAVPK